VSCMYLCVYTYVVWVCSMCIYSHVLYVSILTRWACVMYVFVCVFLCTQFIYHKSMRESVSCMYMCVYSDGVSSFVECIYAYEVWVYIMCIYHNAMRECVCVAVALCVHVYILAMNSGTIHLCIRCIYLCFFFQIRWFCTLRLKKQKKKTK